MTSLALLKDVIPTEGIGPLMGWNRHSYRKFSFYLAREAPYYYQPGGVPHPWNKNPVSKDKYRQAHSSREANYWRAVFDSQLATVEHRETQAILPVPAPPDAEQYAIYPAKNWILVSIKFSQHIIPPGSLPLPGWWNTVGNAQRKRLSKITIRSLEDCEFRFIYPLKPIEGVYDAT